GDRLFPKRTSNEDRSSNAAARAVAGSGWTYSGKDYPGTADVYASVNLGDLKQLKASGFMETYAIYIHNELQIMVAKGNPKKIAGIDDLARADVRTTMPNPVNEGIMQFYARKVLERHGIWQTISGGKECASCPTTERNWFAAVHHRATVQRLRENKTDAGIVWKTEVGEALRQDAQVSSSLWRIASAMRSDMRSAL